MLLIRMATHAPVALSKEEMTNLVSEAEKNNERKRSPEGGQDDFVALDIDGDKEKVQEGVDESKPGRAEVRASPAEEKVKMEEREELTQFPFGPYNNEKGILVTFKDSIEQYLGNEQYFCKV